MQAKRKYLEVLQEKQNLDADRAELQQKYAQKAQQARKLQEMFSKASPEDDADHDAAVSTVSATCRIIVSAEAH